MNKLIEVILNQIESFERKQIIGLIGNYVFKFVPLAHNKFVLDKLQKISEIIRTRDIICITYKKSNDKVVKRVIKTIYIIFSEYYFCLIAYVECTKFENPTIFRIARIDSYERIGRKFYVTYVDRFEEWEFGKEIQFMYQGELIKVKFEFYW